MAKTIENHIMTILQLILTALILYFINLLRLVNAEILWAICPVSFKSHIQYACTIWELNHAQPTAFSYVKFWLNFSLIYSKEHNAWTTAYFQKSKLNFLIKLQLKYVFPSSKYIGKCINYKLYPIFNSLWIFYPLFTTMKPHLQSKIIWRSLLLPLRNMVKNRCLVWLQKHGMTFTDK